MSQQWLLPSSWLHRVILTIALLTSAVSAGGVSIQNPFDVSLFPKRFVAGRGSLVSWQPTAEGTVSLKLYIGASTEMQYISTIAHFIDNTGRFTWTPSIALDASDDYAILIVSDANDQLVDCSPAFALERPVLKRQVDESSYISDYLPYSTTPPPEPSPSTTPGPVTTSPPAAATTSSVDPVPTTPVNGQSSIVPSPATTNPASPTQPGQSSASTSPAAVASSSSNNSSLSTGAAIGIGVGATLLVLALVGLLIFFFRRRRRLQRQNQVEATQNAQTGFSSGPSELETGKAAMTEKMQPVGGGGGGGGGPQSPNMWAASDPKSELEAGAGAAGAGMGAGMSAGRAELSAPPPLSEEEYAELDRRRRAVELQGRSMGISSGGGGGPAELSAQGLGYGYPQGQFAGQGQQQVHPRAELEALRANARGAHELSGQSAWDSGGPGYVQ